MRLDFSKQFDKQFQKLATKKQLAAKSAIALFLHDATTPALRHHALKGAWQGYHSISAGGDLRLHYKVIAQNHVLFVAVGSHSQLYQ